MELTGMEREIPFFGSACGLDRLELNVE